MTVLTKIRLFAGWTANQKENGMRIWRNYVLVCGMSVIAVIFFSGCASTSKQMSFFDINEFQVDCNKRDEQIKMLESMRSTPDDRLFARFRAAFQPWQRFTDPDQYADNWYKGWGTTDAYINYKIQNLVNYCPGKKF